MRARIVVLFLGVCLLLKAQPPIQKFWALNKCNLVISKLSQKPSAAYSLRKLNCSAVKAVNVRRDGDNATQDIGFTSTGDLDQTALMNFVNVYPATSSSTVSFANSSNSTTFTIPVPNASSITSITGITGKMNNENNSLTSSQTPPIYDGQTIILGYYVGGGTRITYMVQVTFTIGANSITITQTNPRYASNDQRSDLQYSYNKTTGGAGRSYPAPSFTSTYIISSITLTLSGSFNGNGYVTTWYDQSGNGKNLTQTTDANQPKIASGGVLNAENGKPTIRFMDTSDKMDAPAMNIQTFSAVRKAFIGGTDATMQYLVSVPIDADFAIRSSSTYTSISWYYGDDNINDFTYGGAMYVNNVLTKTYPSTLHCLCANSGAVNSNSTFSLSTGFTYSSIVRALYGGDPVSELIVFPGILSVGERTTLYTGQKNYYGTN